MNRQQWARGALGAVAALMAATGLAYAQDGAVAAPGNFDQVAARVNDDSISVYQVDMAVSQMPNLKPEQRNAAGKVALERLIDETLASEKAVEAKLDQDPAVVQAIESAKRKILAQRYLKQMTDSVRQPTEAEVERYYASNPALFSARRIYSLQEVFASVEPDQATALKYKLAAATGRQQVLSILQAAGVSATTGQTVRAAEQLPLNQLPAISQMKDGQIRVDELLGKLHVLILAASEPRPVTMDQARPFIEQFLLNQQRGPIIAKAVKAWRQAAKIAYAGSFAPSGATPNVPSEDAPGALDMPSH